MYFANDVKIYCQECGHEFTENDRVLAHVLTEFRFMCEACVRKRISPREYIREIVW